MKGSQIPKILSSAKTLSSRLFNLKYLSQPKNTDVGYIVSVKTAPLAVTRNQLKRRLRHAFAPFISKLPSGQYLILAKPELKNASFKTLTQTIKTLIHEIPCS